MHRLTEQTGVEMDDDTAHHEESLAWAMLHKLTNYLLCHVVE